MAFIDHIDHGPTRLLYRYWLSRRRDCLMPARRLIEPRDIAELLPHIFLADVMPQGRYRYRLVGTHIGEHVGRELTGSYLDELAEGRHYERFRTIFDLVATAPAINYFASELHWQDRSWMMYRRLLLPLSDDGITANMLLGASFYEPRDPRYDTVRRLDETIQVRELENETMALS
ncbi:PAS domain-containing protein [Ferrovibrio sp.]|uniref:PAS domain-containing protein n=1 Tax=Ferrovibrio sp. TaxID=1917215 RepID=UPI003513221E